MFLLRFRKIIEHNHRFCIAASRSNISNISSRLTESKSDILTKLGPANNVSNSLPPTTSQVPTDKSSSINVPHKAASIEKDTPEKVDPVPPKHEEPEINPITSPTGGVKSSPFMAPKESLILNDTPPEVSNSLASIKSHAGGWTRPKEISTIEGETQLQKRVCILIKIKFTNGIFFKLHH